MRKRALCATVFVAGFLTGWFLLHVALAGELQNVKPYPGGTVLMPNNIVFSIRLNEHSEQSFQCQPIVPHDSSTTNPENYSR